IGDNQDHWIGGTTIVVQTGDQLDRGDDELAIFDLLDQLANEAQHAGGAVYVLHGNHELMNAAGDFRYVTPEGFRQFTDYPGVDVNHPRLANIPAHMRGRAAAFMPSGPLAHRMAKR